MEAVKAAGRLASDAMKAVQVVLDAAAWRDHVLATDHIRRKCLVSTKVGDGELGPALAYCDEDVVVWHFHHTITDSLHRTDHAFHLHSELPDLYTRSSTRSALRLSTQAIAYAVSFRSGRSATRNAQRTYADACLAIRLALRSPREAVADETLYAVLLLSGYETITCSSDQQRGWATHVKGVASLLSHRGSDSLKRPLGFKLYNFARRSIILYHIQSCRSAAAIFDGLSHAPSIDENDEDRLYSLMETLSDIQYRASFILDRSADIGRDSTSALLADAKTLDRQLSEWRSNLSSTWSYTIAQNLRDSSPAELDHAYVPTEIHRYRSVFNARILNLYRLSCIILYSTMIRAKASSISGGNNTLPMIEVTLIQARTQDFVNDICSSVQYLSGDDMSKITLPETQPTLHGQRSSCALSSIPTARAKSGNGRYSLLWVLHVASSVSFISESQRRWMQRWLLFIGESGEPLALKLAASRSRILSGGVENFTVDCV